MDVHCANGQTGGMSSFTSMDSVMSRNQTRTFLMLLTLSSPRAEKTSSIKKKPGS